MGKLATIRSIGLFSALNPTVSLPSACTSVQLLQLTMYYFHSYSAVHECLYVSHSFHHCHELRSPAKSIKRHHIKSGAFASLTCILSSKLDLCHRITAVKQQGILPCRATRLADIMRPESRLGNSDCQLSWGYYLPTLSLVPPIFTANSEQHARTDHHPHEHAPTFQCSRHYHCLCLGYRFKMSLCSKVYHCTARLTWNNMNHALKMGWTVYTSL